MITVAKKKRKSPRRGGGGGLSRMRRRLKRVAGTDRAPKRGSKALWDAFSWLALVGVALYLVVTRCG